MRPSDFIVEAYFEQLGGIRRVSDAPRVDKLRLQPEADVGDLDVAHSLALLAHGELETYGTRRGEQLVDEDISVVLRGLRAVLGRLDIKF